MLFKQIRRYFTSLPNLKSFTDVKNHKPEGLSRQQAEEMFKTYNIKQWSWVNRKISLKYKGTQHSEIEIRKNDQITKEVCVFIPRLMF